MKIESENFIVNHVSLRIKKAVLKTFVKVSKVSNLSDARYCAGMMVNQIGFNLLKEAPDYVSPTLFKEITQWVAGIEFIGECGSMDASSILEAIKEYELDAIETSNIETVTPLVNSGYRVSLNLKNHKNVISELSQIVNTLTDEVEHIIIKLPTFSDLKKFNSRENLLVSYNEDLTNLEQLIALEVKGIELEASLEERPGFKDYGQVMDILEALED